MGGVNVRYRHSLKPFQKYTLKTRILGVDEKWFYIEQRFEHKGKLMAYGLVRAVFVSKTQTVPMTLFKTIGPQSEQFLTLWNDMDLEIKKYCEKNDNE